MAWERGVVQEISREFDRGRLHGNWLAGGGEMCARIRASDWSQTPVGPFRRFWRAPDAIDRGPIGSINDPIFSFFPELSDLRPPVKKRTQLLHALTISMGLKWVESSPPGDSHHPGARSRCLGDCRILTESPPSSSSAVRHFQGRLAGQFRPQSELEALRTTIQWYACGLL